MADDVDKALVEVGAQIGEVANAVTALRTDIAELRTLQADTRAAVQTLIEASLQMDATLRLILKAATGDDGDKDGADDAFKKFTDMLVQVRDGQIALPSHVQTAMIEAVTLARGDGIDLGDGADDDAGPPGPPPPPPQSVPRHS